MNWLLATCPKQRDLKNATTALMFALGSVAVLWSPSALAAEDNAASVALDEFRESTPSKALIENKFFLKEGRFEVAPVLGYVPNDSFYTTYVGGAELAYHLKETFALEGMVVYSPNLGVAGVKNLTRTLVGIAYEGNADNFQQPLDKLSLGAIFAARWSPVYGKINLIGEGVANFDLYGTGGVGLIMIQENKAVVSEAYKDDPTVEPVSLVENPQTSPELAGNVGFGFNFFLSQSVAIKLDARFLIYRAQEPDYGFIGADGQPIPLDPRLYGTFMTTAGVSVFMPKMKPRVFNF